MKRRRDTSRGAVRPHSGPTVLDAARAAGLVPGESGAVVAPDPRPTGTRAPDRTAVTPEDAADEVTPTVGMAAVPEAGSAAHPVRTAAVPTDGDGAAAASSDEMPAGRAAAPGGPRLPPRPDARPRIVDDTGILGLSRVSRGRVGSRLFTWFFVFVFTLIAVQMIVALLSS